MRKMKHLRLYAKLSPSARYEFKSWNTLWPKSARGDSTQLSVIVASLLYRPPVPLQFSGETIAAQLDSRSSQLALVPCPVRPRDPVVVEGLSGSADRRAIEGNVTIGQSKGCRSAKILDPEATVIADHAVIDVHFCGRQEAGHCDNGLSIPCSDRIC
jgi:hypothetical protein